MIVAKGKNLIESSHVALNDAFSNTINTVKGWSILLVVLGHIASPLSTLIYSFHIPLFFFLGGLFVNTSHSNILYIKRNLNRLIVPYLIFGFTGWLVNILKNILLHRPSEDILQSATGLLWWMDIEHLNHYGFVLWFLPALFWARLIIFFIEKYLRVNDLLLLSLLILTANTISNLTELPFGIDKALVALPWVFFGLVFNRHKDYLLSMSLWKIIFPVLVVLVLVYMFGLQRLDLATKVIGNAYVSIPYTFGVIFLLVYIVHYIRLPLRGVNFIGRLVCQFGVYSLLVLVIHPYTNNISHLIVSFFLGDGYWLEKFSLSILMLFAFIQMKLVFSKSILFKWL